MAFLSWLFGIDWRWYLMKIMRATIKNCKNDGYEQNWHVLNLSCVGKAAVAVLEKNWGCLNIIIHHYQHQGSCQKKTFFWEIFPKSVYPPTPGFLWDLGVRKVKFGSKRAIFGVIWGGFEGFGPCLGVSHPTHPHLGEISQKKNGFFLAASLTGLSFSIEGMKFGTWGQESIGNDSYANTMTGPWCTCGGEGGDNPLSQVHSAHWLGEQEKWQLANSIATLHASLCVFAQSGPM